MAEVEKRKIYLIFLRKNSKEIRDKISKEIKNVKYYASAEDEKNTWLYHFCNPYEKEVKMIEGNGNPIIDGKEVCKTEQEAHELLIESVNNIENSYIDCGEDIDKFIEELNKNI